MKEKNIRPEGLRFGEWIGAGTSREDRRAPVFRKVFEVARPVRAARAWVCGLGLFELKINGRPADDSLLNPANTQYTQTALYLDFDVTELLRPGKNALTVELGNGFWNENGGVWKWQTARWRGAPRLLLNLELRYADGAVEIVSTDGTWRVTSEGPTVANGIYQGETFDARRSLTGMDRADYDDSAWARAQVVAAPQGRLRPQIMPPIRRTAQLRPAAIERLSDGAILITAPEMLSGWARLRLNLPAGAEAVITYGERLNAQGHVQRVGRGEGEAGEWWPDWTIQQDRFISAGEPFEFEPKFSYKGYRYIEIEGHAADLTTDDISLFRVCNDVEIVSDFRCSSEELNRLHAIMRRTMLNNFQGKPTDTPVWEKNGWLGDANVALSTMLYNFDMGDFLAAFLDTMADCLHEYGTVPVMVPTADWGTENSPVWNSIFVFGAEALYDRCGRLDYARDRYDDLRAYALRQFEDLAAGGWVWPAQEGLADWVSPTCDESSGVLPDGSEGAEICATAFLYAAMRSMERIANLLDKPGDAQEYAAAAERIRSAFNEKFYNPEKGYYETTYWKQAGNRTRYRQTSNLLPLAFDMVPEDRRARVAANLIADVEQRQHLDTGCVGTKFILPVLADLGRADLAQLVLTQPTYPGWFYWLSHGSDSAWEAWEPSTRSLDHYFLGTFDEYFYSHLLGIRDLRDGCRTFTIAPEIHCGLDFAEGHLRTPRGIIRVSWRRDGDVIHLSIDVPSGCTANVRLADQTLSAGEGRLSLQSIAAGQAGPAANCCRL